MGKLLQNYKVVGIPNFKDIFETCKRSFKSDFSICMIVPLNRSLFWKLWILKAHSKVWDNFW